MIVCGEVRSSERADATFRKRALRDAVICIGWLKLISVICYVVLYFLVHSNSEGHMSNVLQVMILTTIPPQILHGVLLFLGALEWGSNPQPTAQKCYSVNNKITGISPSGYALTSITNFTSLTLTFSLQKHSYPLALVMGITNVLTFTWEKLVALELSLWMCLLLASYTTLLGVMGCIYFIRTGHMTFHFLLAVVFAALALSVFTVICHDVLIVFSYKQILLGIDPAPPATSWASK